MAGMDKQKIERPKLRFNIGVCVVTHENHINMDIRTDTD